MGYELLWKEDSRCGGSAPGCQRPCARPIRRCSPHLGAPSRSGRIQEPLAPAPPADDDGIIRRFEALLVHGPKNIKIHKTLAEAYARKMMFDKSLSFYQSALKIAGGKNAAIEKAIEETTLKKIDRELSQLDRRPRITPPSANGSKTSG